MKLIIALVLFQASIILAMVFLGGLPGPNESMGLAASGGSTAGFWYGVWHGFTSNFSVIYSLFKEGVQIYEVNNSGVGYNWGFLIGVGLTTKQGELLITTANLIKAIFRIR